MRRFLLAIVALIGCSCVSAAHAGLGPENVAVVVNADSWASMTVANAFISNHGVPLGNVIYLEDVPGYEHIGVEEFRERLLKPVLKAIDERGLKEQIDCIAWSSDFPYGIEVQADVDAAKLKLPQVFTPVASINGLTFLYEQVLAKDPRYLELASNWYYRRPFRPETKPAAELKAITEAEAANYREAMKLIEAKKWSEASPLLAGLAKAHPNEMQLQYNLACCLAREEKLDDAMAALKAAVEAGWFDRQHTEKDEDLKPLRERPEFKDLVAKMKPPLFDVQPTTGFRSTYRWNEKGDRVETGGRSYMLSVVLAVTSGRGNSIGTAGRFRPSHDESQKAMRDGTFYFVKNGDVRSRTREWAFASAAEKLRKLGLKAEVVDGVLPEKSPGVSGAVIGIADFDWPKSGSTLCELAIAEHLTSFGGVLREHSGQTPLTAFLKHGAAGSSGTVTEPYAIQAKFPTAFLHVHYASGATLAEAFYQSVQGPYQLLIVGDPLAAPFVGDPDDGALSGLEGQEPLNAKTTVRPEREEDLKDDAFPKQFEYFVDGKRIGRCGRDGMELDPDKFPDGFHQLTVQGIAEGPAEVRRTHAAHSFVVRKPTLEMKFDFGNNRLNLSQLIVTKLEGLFGISVRCPDASSIVVRCNGRPLAEIAGTEGVVGIPLTDTGDGYLRLDAAATTARGTVFSEPVGFFMSAGREYSPQEDIVPMKREDGLLLQVEGREPAVVADLRNPGWIAEQKLPPGTRFALEAVFEETEERGSHSQFQLTGNCAAEVLVDGVRVAPVRPSAWQYLPVRLKPGWHRLRIEGRTTEEAGASPRLVVRYGSEGTLSLNGARFKHVLK